MQFPLFLNFFRSWIRCDERCGMAVPICAVALVLQVDALAVTSRLGLARGFLLRRLCTLAFEMLG